MTLSELRNARQSRPRQSSICFHHLATAAEAVFDPRAFQSASMSSSTAATSPTIGTWTWMFLLIEEGSMSTWTLNDPGEKASVRPVIRSSKRAPMQSMKSQSCIVQLAS